MNTFSPSNSVLANELETLRDYWGWFLVLGIVMVVLGTVALGWSCLGTVTIAAVWVFGLFLLGCGIAEIVNSFWIGRWSGMLIHLLLGALYALVGVLVIDHPATAAVQLTLLIAIWLMVSGVFRIIYSVSEHFTGRGWVLLNGAVSLLLGILIYKQWPESGFWVIGLFIGIDLIFNGWAWIMLSLGLRPKAAAA